MTVMHDDRTPPPGGSVWRRLAAVLRGVLAVAVLLASAVDDMVTAALGVAPVLPRAARGVRRVVRPLGREIGDAFRGGRDDVVDAEVIEDARRWA